MFVIKKLNIKEFNQNICYFCIGNEKLNYKI